MTVVAAYTLWLGNSKGKPSSGSPRHFGEYLVGALDSRFHAMRTKEREGVSWCFNRQYRLW